MFLLTWPTICQLDLQLHGHLKCIKTLRDKNGYNLLHSFRYIGKFLPCVAIAIYTFSLWIANVEGPPNKVVLAIETNV